MMPIEKIDRPKSRYRTQALPSSATLDSRSTTLYRLSLLETEVRDGERRCRRSRSNLGCRIRRRTVVGIAAEKPSHFGHHGLVVDEDLELEVRDWLAARGKHVDPGEVETLGRRSCPDHVFLTATIGNAARVRVLVELTASCRVSAIDHGVGAG